MSGPNIVNMLGSGEIDIEKMRADIAEMPMPTKTKLSLFDELDKIRRGFK